MRTFLIALCVSASAVAQDPILDDTTYPGYRDYLTPKAGDEAWRAIGWRTSYWAAVTEGNQKGLPILLWTMNGHPLACT